MACSIACAGAVFAQLPKEALVVMKEVSNTAKTSLNGLKVAKNALKLSLDISLLPLQIKRNALEAIIGDLRGKTRVIPSNLVLQCPQLGGINTALESALLSPLENVSNIIFEIDNLLSSKIQLQAEISQIDAAVAFFDSVIGCLDEALAV